jgi:hypothetical protein
MAVGGIKANGGGWQSRNKRSRHRVPITTFSHRDWQTDCNGRYSGALNRLLLGRVLAARVSPAKLGVCSGQLIDKCGSFEFDYAFFARFLARRGLPVSFLS